MRKIILIQILRVSILAIALLFAVQPLFSQGNLVVGEEMKASSTDTWNFIKYGEIGANLHTGTVHLSIPVYTYQDNDFNIPITLNYSSNGLVANMRAGILGPDWVLSAGGKISVEVNGINDLKSTIQDADTYYQYHNLTNPNQNGTYWRQCNFPDRDLQLGAIEPQIIYVPEPGKSIINNTPKYDAQPDFFHFNFMGYSGTFHLGTNGNIYVYNTAGDNKLHKIELIKNSENNIDISFTDKHGYKYEFHFNDIDRGQDYTGETKQPVAYNLSRITAPNGRTVDFLYNMDIITTYRPATFANTGALLDYGSDGNIVQNNDNYSDRRTIETTTLSRSISGIKVDGKSIAEFTYTHMSSGTRDQYARTQDASLSEFDECIRLQGIRILNPYSSTRPVVKEAGFSYTRTQGARINYLASVEMSGEGTYSLNYYNVPNGSFPPIGTFSVDHWGYYNGKSVSSFLKIVSTNTTTMDETLSSTTRDPNASYAKSGMLQRITYPTGGYSELEYEAHSYGKAFLRNSSNNFIPTLATQSGTCGGLRIKSISNHTEDGTLASKKTYGYTTSTGASSGILLYFPKYWLNYSAQAGNYSEQNINYWSNSLLSYNGQHIEYSIVTQTNMDNSREVYHFSNSAMSVHYRDAVDISSIEDEVSPQDGIWSVTNSQKIRNIVAPLTSRKAERGKLLRHEIYAAGGVVPQKETIYTYDTTRPLAQTSYPVYLIRKFGQSSIVTDNYRLASKTEKETNNGVTITRTESYTYNSKGQVASITSTSSTGITEIARYTYPADHTAEGGVYTAMVNKNLHAYPVTHTIHLLENGIEKQISGKKYTYSVINGMVKPYSTYRYNSISQGWEVETRYTQYDTYGNLLESYDSNNIPTSYIWGYNGMYLVGTATNTPRSVLSQYIANTPLAGEIPESTANSINGNGNGTALLTTYHYTPLVGLTKIRYPNGITETYTYNVAGKLMDITNHLGKRRQSNYYSPDNRY